MDTQNSPNPPQKNKKLITIVVILLLIGAIALVYFFFSSGQLFSGLSRTDRADQIEKPEDQETQNIDNGKLTRETESESDLTDTTSLTPGQKSPLAPEKDVAIASPLVECLFNKPDTQVSDSMFYECIDKYNLGPGSIEHLYQSFTQCNSQEVCFSDVISEYPIVNNAEYQSTLTQCLHDSGYDIIECSYELELSEATIIDLYPEYQSCVENFDHSIQILNCFDQAAKFATASWSATDTEIISEVPSSAATIDMGSIVLTAPSSAGMLYLPPSQLTNIEASHQAILQGESFKLRYENPNNLDIRFEIYDDTHALGVIALVLGAEFQDVVEDLTEVHQDENPQHDPGTSLYQFILNAENLAPGSYLYVLRDTEDNSIKYGSHLTVGAGVTKELQKILTESGQCKEGLLKEWIDTKDYSHKDEGVPLVRKYQEIIELVEFVKESPNPSNCRIMVEQDNSRFSVDLEDFKNYQYNEISVENLPIIYQDFDEYDLYGEAYQDFPDQKHVFSFEKVFSEDEKIRISFIILNNQDVSHYFPIYEGEEEAFPWEAKRGLLTHKFEAESIADYAHNYVDSDLIDSHFIIIVGHEDEIRERLQKQI